MGGLYPVTDSLFMTKANGAFKSPKSMSLIFCDTFLISVNCLLKIYVFSFFLFSACTSMVANNNSLDYPLLVADGAYVYTANSCVMCKCDSANNWT